MARTSRKDDALENTNMFGNQDGDKNIKRRDPLAALGDINTAVNADGAQNKNFLDPDLTLRSPIGPPSRASTPQDACSGEESRMFEDSKLTVDFQQTSPSLIRTECVEDLRCTLLPRLLSVDGEIRESSEPQSPTIPTRSHSIMKNMDNDVSPEIRNAKRKRSLDVTFGSLLAEPEHLDLKREDLKANVCESAKSVLTEERRELVENCQKNPTIQVSEALF